MPITCLTCIFSSRFRLTAPAKSVHWGVPWDVPDDSMLLVGIFEYGLGSWEAIKADQSLLLSSKVKGLRSLLEFIESFTVYKNLTISTVRLSCDSCHEVLRWSFFF